METLKAYTLVVVDENGKALTSIDFRAASEAIADEVGDGLFQTIVPSEGVHWHVLPLH